jgi:carbon-monoxide dehydrogenase large subunit
MPMTPDRVWETLDEAELAHEPAHNVEFDIEESPADD